MSVTRTSERRIEGTAVILCAGATAAAWLGPGGSARLAASVACGGLLMAVSYATMRVGVGVLASLLTPAAARPSRAPTAGRVAFGIGARYALLALLAYVMIARLRLHPLGLLAGVSSVVAAASIEAIRLQLQKKP